MSEMITEKDKKFVLDFIQRYINHYSKLHESVKEIFGNELVSDAFQKCGHQGWRTEVWTELHSSNKEVKLETLNEVFNSIKNLPTA